MRDGQILRLRAKRLAWLRNVVDGDRLPGRDRDQGHSALHVLHPGEVHLRVATRYGDPLHSERVGGDRQPRLEVPGGYDHAHGGTASRVSCVESYEDEGC